MNLAHNLCWLLPHNKPLEAKREQQKATSLGEICISAEKGPTERQGKEPLRSLQRRWQQRSELSRQTAAFN